LGSQWKVFLTALIEATWASLASESNLTTFLEYSRFNLNRWTQLKVPTQELPIALVQFKQIYNAPPDAEGGVGSIRVAWRVSNLKAGWGMIVYLSTTPGANPTNSNVVAVIPMKVGTTEVWISGIDPGLWWVGFESFGTKGSQFAQDTNKLVVVT